MFSIVSLLASCLWVLWYCCSWKQQRRRLQQQQSLHTALLGNASINDV
jgi:preprotein translocase subunit YajC